MCETNGKLYHGWRGWGALPTPPKLESIGNWIDLSHPLHENMPRANVFPAPRFSPFKSQPADPLTITEMQMCVHVGTHVDSPRHFLIDGPAFDDIPLDRLSGSGVVWNIETTPDGLIDVAHLESARPRIRPGDMVVINTGWWKLAGTPAYDHHPCLSESAASWLVEQKIKLVGVDLPTPDLPINRRPLKNFDWPVHKILLSNGVLVSEHLTNLDVVGGHQVEFAFHALNIKGSDGAPARVVARMIVEQEYK